MNNAELIKALQCASHFALYQDCYEKNCYANSGKGLYCNIPKLMADASDALEAADKRIARLEDDLKTREAEREVLQDTIKICEEAADRYKAQMPKEGEWLRTDAFPHRVYCSCCYKTYVPNENWQIWQDDADNFGLPRNYCPNCGARMKGGQE